MALGTTGNVRAGIPDSSGGLWVSDQITDPAQFPDSKTDLKTAGFISVGFVSEDGVTEGNNRDVQKVKAWGGDTVRVLQNEHEQTFSFSLIEAGNPEVLKLVYGDENVIINGENDIQILQNSKTLPHKSFVIEIKDGPHKVRKFIPDGQITETGEITWVHSDIVKFDLTMEAFVDVQGNKVYSYSTLVSGSGKPGEQASTTPVLPDGGEAETVKRTVSTK